jgi:hypothetical protein
MDCPASVHKHRCDPLLYATANGDSRYDDQLGMAIDPRRSSKRYLAANPVRPRRHHHFLKQLQAIDRSHLSDKAAPELRPASWPPKSRPSSTSSASRSTCCR